MNTLYNKILNEVYLIQDFDSWDNSENTFKKNIQQNLLIKGCFKHNIKMDVTNLDVDDIKRNFSNMLYSLYEKDGAGIKTLLKHFHEFLEINKDCLNSYAKNFFWDDMTYVDFLIYCLSSSIYITVPIDTLSINIDEICKLNNIENTGEFESWNWGADADEFFKGDEGYITFLSADNLIQHYQNLVMPFISYLKSFDTDIYRMSGSEMVYELAEDLFHFDPLPWHPSRDMQSHEIIPVKYCPISDLWEYSGRWFHDFYNEIRQIFHEFVKYMNKKGIRI